MRNQEAARVLGLKETEVAGVEETPIGPVVTVVSGVRYVIVPDDQPDGDGKTGVMLAEKPDPTRRYDFPVYVPHPPDPVEPSEDGDTDELPDAAGPDVGAGVRGGD